MGMLSLDDNQFQRQLGHTAFPIYLNKFTTRMDDFRINAYSGHGKLTSYPHVTLILHYLLPVIGLNTFRVVETTLMVNPCVGSCLEKRTYQFEYKKMKQAQMVNQIALFHHSIAHGKSYFFYQQDRVFKNFLGNNSTHYTLNPRFVFSPFKNNTGVMNIDAALRFLSFEVIHFMANEPIRQYHKFSKYLILYGEISINTIGGSGLGGLSVIDMGRQIDFSFTTKEGIRRMLDFELYVRVYDGLSWLFILFFCILFVPAVIWMLVFIHSHPMSTIAIYGQLLALTYSTLLEVSPETPSVLMEMSRKFKFRIIIGSWLLLSIVLTNAYKGLVVTDLTAPQPLTGTYSHFRDLEEFILVSAQHFIDRMRETIHGFRDHATLRAGLISNPSCMSLSEYTINNKAEEPCAYAEYIFDLVPGDQRYNYSGRQPAVCLQIQTQESISITKAYNTIRESNSELLSGVRWYKWENTCELESFGLPKKLFILRRNSYDKSILTLYKQSLETSNTLARILPKSAVVETTEIINSLNAYVGTLKPHNVKGRKELDFMKGKEGIYEDNLYIEIHSRKYAKPLYDRIQLIFGSGIYQIWDKWVKVFHPTLDDELIMEHLKLEARYDSRVEKLDLQGNVISAFYIYGVGLVPVFLLFTIEIRRLIKNAIGLVLNRIRKKLLSLCSLIWRWRHAFR